MKNPLLDSTFLHQLDAKRNRVTYARLTSLTVEGLPVERIEGVFTGGSITIDGSSAVRRICNLTMTTKNLNMNNIYWGLTTRVKVEIGLKNDVIVPNQKDPYQYIKDYPEIIWFPQGVFIITDFKTSNQVNNYTITLSGKDKMCLLNGDVGGNFNAETDCGTVDWQNKDGNWINQKLTIPQIIYNLVREYAQEPEDNIIIKDIEKGLEMLRNNSTEPMYVIEDIEKQEYVDFLYKDITDVTSKSGITPAENNQTSVKGSGPQEYSPKYVYYLSQEIIQTNSQVDSGIVGTEEFIEYEATTTLRAKSIVNFEKLEKTNFKFKATVSEDDNSLINVDPYEAADKIYYYDPENNGMSSECVIIKVEPGEDVGYRMMDIVYPDELIAAPNETVVSIFDKIIKAFGVYEYFYNLEGKFVFQAKETYVNTAWNAIIKRDDETFIDPSQVSAYVQYNFEGSRLTTAYQNSPKMGDIKNDYTVWGKRKNALDHEIPIHMRYAIDIKPKFYRNFEGEVFMSSDYFKEFTDIALEKQAPYRNHILPKVLQNDDPISWWHIEDWYQYYQAITGSLPTQNLSSYQASTSHGFTGRLYFPDTNGDIKLICAVEDPPANKEDYEDKVVYLGSRWPVFIFDMVNNFPVGWSESVSPNNGLSAAFMHRFNNCGHLLSWFIDHAHKNHYESYCYQPYIPLEDGNEDIDMINPHLVKQVDWREIIYQMAKDYYKHHLEDDFSIRLRQNNIVKYKNLNLYPNGRTGYEQYYHDIEAFWRTLYYPVDYEPEGTSRIFNNFLINFDIESKQSYYDHGTIATINASEETQKKFLYWNKNVVLDPASLYFWFDFFDAEALGLGPFSVPAIGARPKVVNNDKVKAIIYKGIPNIIFSADDNESIEVEKNFPGYKCFQINNVLTSAHEVAVIESGTSTSSNTQIDTVKHYTFYLLTRSSRSITAQEEMDDLLYNYSYCNETVTIKVVPVYYLEPNTIISAKDEQRIVNGYYIINKITIPLTYNGTSTITAIKVPERIY